MCDFTSPPSYVLYYYFPQRPPDSAECNEIRVNCVEFDVVGNPSKNCRRRDFLKIFPDKKTKYCGTEGPDIILTSEEGKVVCTY